MKRRSFFKTLGALALAPLLPQPSPWEAPLEFTTREGWPAFDSAMLDNYYGIIHPSVWVSIKEMVARTAWVDRYRDYRKELRLGGVQKTPQQIMADWKPMYLDGSEFGTINGIRFIQSESIKGINHEAQVQETHQEA